MTMWSAAVHPRISGARVRGTAAPRLDRAVAHRVLHLIGLASSFLLVASLITVITLWIQWRGGAPTAFMHLYYLPVLYAGARHGRLAAVVVGFASGIAGGPWMPSSSTPDAVQPVRDWLIRLFFFMLVGFVAAWLARQEPVPVEQSLRDAVVGHALRSALRHDAIKAHYQPFISLSDGRVLGAEALCRWYDKAGRAASPAHFIPVAERTGSVGTLGRSIAKMAASQAQLWSRQRDSMVTVAINVSAIELSDPTYLNYLRELVNKYATDKVQLCLEITETALMVNPQYAKETLATARALGVIVALDDFGTGQSSLAYLSGFPIDVIKIDASFVATVEKDEFSQALIAAVVQLAASLGARTVAEGIETPGQLNAVRELGCDIGQGYYLGRPSAANELDWSPRSLESL